MNWELNRFYKLQEAGAKPKETALKLLNGFPMTRVALAVLQEELIAQLEVAALEEGQAVIREGDKGKDLFLVLESGIDVLVGGKKVMEMQSPALLGDKAIIEPDSTRSATIQVAQGQQALVLKIPMGLFLRDVTHAEIPDATFQRERQLYLGLFNEIQKRLFDSIHLQQKAFEVLSTSVAQVNARWAALVLGKGEDRGWPKEVYRDLGPFLEAKFNFKPQGGFPAEPAELARQLRMHLKKTFPRESFSGTDAQYQVRMDRTWSKWLQQAASQVLKHLKEDQLAFTIKDINLFNPLNYRDTLVRTMAQMEAYYPKKTQDPASKRAGFFQSGGHANLFELSKFQKYVDARYQLRYPNRVQARMAASMAHVAAVCENQFNSSLARIKGALEKLEKLDLEPEQKKEINPQEVQKFTALLATQVQNYHRAVAGGVGDAPMGEIVYNPISCPVLSELIRMASTPVAKDQIKNAIYNLSESYGLLFPPMDRDLLQEGLSIVQGLPDFKVAETQLKGRYWIPLSLGVRLVAGDNALEEVIPGSVVGGPIWFAKAEESGHQRLSLKVPPRIQNGPIDQSGIFLVFSDLSLITFEMDPHRLDWMFWLKGLHLRNIARLAKKQDDLLEQVSMAENASKKEKKIKEFETREMPLKPAELRRIFGFLKNFADMDNVQEGFSTKLLSQQIYQHILARERQANPTMAEEERRNQVYTQWRFALTEIIQMLDVPDLEEEKIQLPVMAQLAETLILILEEEGVSEAASFLKLAESEPDVDLKGIFESLDCTDPMDQQHLFRKMMEALEKAIYDLYLGTGELQKRLEQLGGLGKNDEEALHRQHLADLGRRLSQEMAPLLPVPI